MSERPKKSGSDGLNLSFRSPATRLKAEIREQLKETEKDSRFVNAVLGFVEAAYYIGEKIGKPEFHTKMALKNAQKQGLTLEEIERADLTAQQSFQGLEAHRIEQALAEERRKAEEMEKRRVEQEAQKKLAQLRKLQRNFQDTMEGDDLQLRLRNSNERVLPITVIESPYLGAEKDFKTRVINRAVSEQDYQAEIDFQEAQAFKYDPRLVVRDIIGHIKKFTPDAPIDDLVKELVRFRSRDRGKNERPMTGEGALRRTIVPSIGFVAARMEWQRHTSPEVAYMSGYHLMWLGRRHIPYLDRRIQAIAEGERVFINDEAKVAAIEREQQKVAQITLFVGEMGQALDKHIQENLSGDPRYLVLLRSLMYMDHFRRETQGNHIMRLLRQNKIAEAMRMLPQRYH